jgi:hypothetical protein
VQFPTSEIRQFVRPNPLVSQREQATRKKFEYKKKENIKGHCIIVKLPVLTARYPVPFADSEFGTCLVSKKTQSWTDHPSTPGADPACNYDECVASDTDILHSFTNFII